MQMRVFEQLPESSAKRLVDIQKSQHLNFPNILLTSNNESHIHKITFEFGCDAFRRQKALQIDLA